VAAEGEEPRRVRSVRAASGRGGEGRLKKTNPQISQISQMKRGAGHDDPRSLVLMETGWQRLRYFHVDTGLWKESILKNAAPPIK